MTAAILEERQARRERPDGTSHRWFPMRGPRAALAWACTATLAGCGSSSSEPAPISDRGEVLTSRNDNARTGANLEEDVIDVAAARRLRLVAEHDVDGELYAQPLVAADVRTELGERTLVIAATMNDSVYAFDLSAASGEPPVWHVGGAGELGAPGESQRNVDGPHGILSTPVIDRSAGRIYVVSRDCRSSAPVNVGTCDRQVPGGDCAARLSALDLATGEVLATTEIAGSIAGVAFDPVVQWNRPALLLDGDAIFVAFGSGPVGDLHEEEYVYHGWVFRYDVTDLERPPAVFATTPRGSGGSVWQSGAGPASDGQHVYFVSANPIVGCSATVADFPLSPVNAEDSVIKLPVDHAGNDDDGALPVGTATFSDTRAYTADGHEGTVFQFTSAGDNGFGSSGPTLIPDSPDMVVGTKNGQIYLLDRETLTALHDPILPFTELPLQTDHTLYIHSWSGIPVVFGSLVTFRPADADGAPAPYSYVYGWAHQDKLRAMRYEHEARTLALETTADIAPINRGGFLALSAEGGRPGSAVLWATSRAPGEDAEGGHIWAFDALTLELLWDDATPAFSKFTPPTVARGRVIVASAEADGPKKLLVYAPAISTEHD